MMLYSTPAHVDDFGRSAQSSDLLHKAWDARVRRMIGSELGHAFFGVLEDASGVANPDPALIPWDAFPRSLGIWFGGLDDENPEARADAAAEVLRPRTYYRLSAGEMQPFEVRYRQQDEYCEWHSWRDGHGLVTRIALTCENPEYWTVLAEGDRALLVDLYKDILKTNEVRTDDLLWAHDVFVRSPAGEFEVAYRRDEYNPFNVWNIEKGLIHLAHPSNSLEAEVHLAAQGAWRYPNDAELDPRGLLCCGGHGRVERISDPRIAWEVNNAVRSGLSVALADPVGLYIQPFSFELLDRNDRDVSAECVRVARGDAAGRMVLRVEIEPPAGADYSLADLRLADGSSVSGARVARRLSVGLFAIIKPIPGIQPKIVDTCTAFCCRHPNVPSYRAAFSKAEDPAVKACDAVPADWWRRHEPVEAVSDIASLGLGQEGLARSVAAPDAVAKPSRASF